MKEPSSGHIEDSKFNLHMGSKVSVNLSGKKMSPMEEFFLGNSEISLGLDTFPGYFEIEESGKVKIGVNKPKDESFEEFKKDMEKAFYAPKCLKKFGGKKAKMGGVKPLEWYVAGYGEGIIKDGVATVDVNILAYMKAGASWKTYWLVVGVPVYVKTGVEGKLQGEIEVRANYDHGWDFTFTKGDVEPSIKGSVELGAGVEGALSIGIEGSGDLAFLYRFTNNYYKLSTTLEGKVKAKAFLLEYSKTWGKYTQVWFDGYANSKSAIAADAENSLSGFDMKNLYNFDNYQQIPRSYMTVSEKESSLKRGMLSFDTDSEVIRKNTFTNALPRYIQAGDQQYCFFLEDADSVEGIANRAAPDRTILVYSKRVGDDEWTDPKPVIDDGTADFDFDLTSTGSDVYVVWQNMGKVFGNTSPSFDDYYMNSDLAAAKISDDTITKLTIPTTDNSEQLPRITSGNSNVSIAWYNNDDEFLTSKANSYTLYGANLSDTTFEIFTSHAINTGAVNGLDIGYVGNDPVIAYVLDENQDLTNMDDDELVYIRNDTVTSLTDNSVPDTNPVFVREDGQDVLYWSQGGVFCSSNGLAAPVQIAEKNGSTQTDDFAVLTNQSGTVKKIVWSGFSEQYAEGIKALFAVDFKNGKWSDSYELSGLGNGSISALDGYLDSLGEEHIVLQRVVYDENTSDDTGEGDENVSEVVSSDIFYVSSGDRRSLRIDNVDYDPNEAGSECSLPVTLTVTNTGNTRITSVLVTIGDYFSKNVDTDLEPGASCDIVVDNFVVPEIFEPYDAEICIEEINDESVDDVFCEFEPVVNCGYTDVGVTEEDHEISEDEEFVVLNIENHSKTDANNVNIKVLADEAEGQVLSDVFYEKLPAGESQSLYIPMSRFSSADIAYMRLITDDEEVNTFNNTGIIALSRETDEQLKEVQFTISSSSSKGQTSYVRDEGKTEEDPFVNGENVLLKAEPVAGNVFTGWTEVGGGEVGGSFADPNVAETQYLLPLEDVEVVGNFAEINHATDISDEQSGVNKEVYIDDRFTFNPTVTTENGDDTTDYIKWTSSKESVANVVNGEVVAVGAGTATITGEIISRGSDGDTQTGKKVIYPVTVSKHGIDAIYLSDEKVTLQGAGDTINFSDELIVLPSSGEGEIKWSSDQPSVAYVDQNGKVTAVSKGTATITAAVKDHDDIKVSCQVEVVTPLNGILLNTVSVDLERGDAMTLTVTPLPADPDEQVSYTWKTLNESVVTVAPSGNHASIKAVGTGSTAVTVTAGNGVTAYCMIRVSAHAKSITVFPTALTLNKFAKEQLKYTLDPEDSEDEVTWSSSNYEVASVDEWNGYVTGKSAGTAIITAETETGLKASCRVTVNPYGDVMEIPEDVERVRVSSWNQLESSHNYQNDTKKLWTYTVGGATSITLHFSEESYMESGYDFLYVLDGNNRLIEKLTGNLSKQSVNVIGNTVKLYLVSDESDTDYGFKVIGVAINAPSSASTDTRTPSNVTDIKITGIKITGISKKIVAGKTIRIKAAVSPAGAVNKTVKWSSSNKKVATVTQSGKVKIKKGTGGKTVKIYAQATDGSGVTAVWKITVMRGVVKKITIKGKSTIKAGKKMKLKAVVKTTKGKANKKLLWTSSNNKYATVTQSGQVKAYKAGKGKTVKITAMSTDGTNIKKVKNIKIK
ncbi:MAG: Ig-like domain-containing protein [Lachnospiraceae bacterium]|nr:Ig-like domain-containing protein [Lachnospiraceae bacterium]